MMRWERFMLIAVDGSCRNDHRTMDGLVDPAVEASLATKMQVRGTKYLPLIDQCHPLDFDMVVSRFNWSEAIRSVAEGFEHRYLGIIGWNRTD